MAAKYSTEDAQKAANDWPFKTTTFLIEMSKNQDFFHFSQKEVDLAFEHAKPTNKIDGLKLLQAPLQAINTDLKYGKILIIISQKVGKAHERNLLRRRIKSIFQEEKLYEKPVISILLTYKSATKLSFEQIKEFLIQSFKQHEKK